MYQRRILLAGVTTAFFRLYSFIILFVVVIVKHFLILFWNVLHK